MLLSGLALGAVLGAVMQRGRFCVTGMLRDLFTLRQSRGLVALFVVIAVHAVGLAALTSAGVIAPEYPTFRPAAVIVGGFIFGLSIILAGGCASGTWYRSAEGLVGSWFALLFYGLSAAAMKTGALSGFNAWMKTWDTGWTTLPETLHVSPWWFAVPLALGTAWAARSALRHDAARPKAELDQPWYRKPLHPYAAGAAIGLLGVIAWPLSAATGRNDGLGITTPTAHVVGYTVTGEAKFLNWGTFLVLGLFVGAFAAAKASGEFRVRVPDATTTLRAIVGGIGMGVGASLAGGCTVGNGMVQTSLFSYQGWIALAMIAAGVFVGSKLWLKPEAAPAKPQPFQMATGLVTLPQTKATKARPLGDGRYSLDTLGAVCPFPLIEAKDALVELNHGEKLVIDFDCTQATESIPQWAADNGHGIEGFTQKGDAGWQITVVKNAFAATPVS
ncbi:YeeE/YedE thiosulfate transporter family protein [uncultured Corynebacterium sp.]|uniref:YeeE/YedE thiosulfate transporter family protein n=1 Tax=uncultured Corynebacterium sp. TaxID=159447 RepID=UPI0025960464|nr:YeeE/YedE thiosulfate transporter family protein [uncultured Corynebacterium sp.]